MNSSICSNEKENKHQQIYTLVLYLDLKTIFKRNVFLFLELSKKLHCQVHLCLVEPIHFFDNRVYWLVLLIFHNKNIQQFL